VLRISRLFATIVTVGFYVCGFGIQVRPFWSVVVLDTGLAAAVVARVRVTVLMLSQFFSLVERVVHLEKVQDI